MRVMRPLRLPSLPGVFHSATEACLLAFSPQMQASMIIMKPDDPVKIF
jgi:hypothetical protein